MAPRHVDPSVLIRYYRDHARRDSPRLPFALTNMTLTTTPLGLGDAVVLTDLPRAAAAAGRIASVHLPNRHFQVLARFNPFYENLVTPFWAAADIICEAYDIGNGHFIQRIRRAWGYEPDPVPRGCIIVPGASVKKGSTVLHFEAGAHSTWQRQNLHPRARQIYPENLSVLQSFIRSHPEMHFLEVGSTFSKFEGTENCTGLPLEDAIQKMAQCEYFIGIISGPMHVAAALGLRCITIINFPDPHSIFLPVLKEIDTVESEWLYPQSTLLHQDGEGPLVARFSLDNLERALNGELYPYWSEQYLPLILEKL